MRAYDLQCESFVSDVRGRVSEDVQEFFLYIMLLTLKELPAACSGSSPRQGQPHNCVSALLDAAQPVSHHLVELRHGFRNG